MTIAVLVQSLVNRKKFIITASASVVTVLVAVACFQYPGSNKPPIKMRPQIFRHAVINDSSNPMNCMAGPWNVCASDSKQRR